jgi:hypothetical protein
MALCGHQPSTTANPKGDNEMRTFSDMTEEQWTPIYCRCMKLAEEAGKAEYAALPPKQRKQALKTQGFFFSHQAKFWSDLWVSFTRGEIDEEGIKATFYAGMRTA